MPQHISFFLAGLVSKNTYSDYPENSLHSSSLDQDSSVISVSAPVASVSTDHMHESTPERGLQSAESNGNSRKVGKGNTVQSPRSASSSVRRSSRLKVTDITSTSLKSWIMIGSSFRFVICLYPDGIIKLHLQHILHTWFYYVVLSGLRW